MKVINSTFVAAVALIGGLFIGAPMQAMAQGSADVGFTIPTEEEVAAARENRRSYALGERLGRAVVTAFEQYEEELIRDAIATLESVTPRTEYEEAYIGRFLGTMWASLPEEEADMDRATDLLEAAVEKDVLSYSDQMSSLQLLGNLYLQAERYEDAISAFRRYLQFRGVWEPDVLFRMAVGYMELKDFPRVITHARKAIENYETPNHNPYVLMIGAYFEQEDIPNAIAVLEEGIQEIPTQIRWWSQLGAFYALNEQLDKSLSTLAIAYDAGYLDRSADFRYLVQMYANKNIPFYAAEVMERHMNNGDIDETPQYWASTARNFYTAREFERAGDVYNKAIALAETDEDRLGYYRSQGDSYVLAEEYRRAAASFQAALDIGTTDNDLMGRLYMSLAEAYFNSNQYRSAINAMRNATRYDATRRNAESWMEYIRQTAERRGVNL
ncbi:tetratricopeptide repeat protein [Aliidiomarina celeris]|uniref:tetratricopeptide repeat protein n=1 Tax=Aliidiomarina celeris TaxID=2249428 RepID=UPI000DEA51EA|nr:hypothetical protein [Aliidiomarina celeris]